MRVLIGLAALSLAATQVNGLVTVTVGGPNTASMAQSPPTGATALARFQIRTGSPTGGNPQSVTPGSYNEAGDLTSNNWQVNVANSVTALNFRLTTNVYTAQIQYRYFPDYGTNLIFPWNAANPTQTARTQTNYWCDPCTGATTADGPVKCNTATGPGPAPSATPAAGFSCAVLTRDYLLSGLVSTGNTPQTQVSQSISFQLFDTQTAPGANLSSYSFVVIRATSIIVGDPQIVGMQGQDFQVHGMPDEIFNIVSYPSLQINARFTYLESADCHDNFTACFAHPGTYISEEGLRVGKDKIRVQAGSFKKGLTVTVNGKKAHKNVDLKHGAVEMVSHRRVVIHTDVMKISISNSDKFMNQELELADDKLISLGSSRTVLKDNERFHPEVPLHGLQGQTWRNVEYASGLEYEGSIMDYHVVDGNLFGTDFVFNQFQS